MNSGLLNRTVAYARFEKHYFLQSNEIGKEVKGMYILSTPVIMVKYVTGFLPVPYLYQILDEWNGEQEQEGY